MLYGSKCSGAWQGNLDIAAGYGRYWKPKWFVYSNPRFWRLDLEIRKEICGIL